MKDQKRKTAGAQDAAAELKPKPAGLLLIGALLSFFGWCIETIFMYHVEGKLVDRGFLFLPLCPIYGCTMIIVYLLLGTPQNGRITRKLTDGKMMKTSFPKKLLVFFVYFVSVALIASFAELIVGSVSDKVFQLTLWEYNSYPFNLWGYVCLQFSIIWGILITTAMTLFWRPLTRLVAHLSEKAATLLCRLLCIFLLTDIVFNFAYLFLHSEPFDVFAHVNRVLKK